jgi:hypothetical protein
MANVDDYVMIPERDTIRMCQEVLDTYHLWVGGSTGTVLCGVRQYQDRLAADDTVVAISPDMGDRYLDTVYNSAWVEERFGQIERHHRRSGSLIPLGLGRSASKAIRSTCLKLASKMPILSLR